MRGIDPKWPAALSALVAVELAIGHGTISLTNAVPAHWIPIVQAWCNIGAFVGTTISGILSAYSSPTAGPMINPPTTTVAKAIIVALAAALLLFPVPSKADPIATVKADIAKLGFKPVTTLKVKPATTASTPAASAATGPLTLAQFMNKLEAITATVVADVTADLNAADADAGTIVTPAIPATATTPAFPAVVRDPIAHACYPALVQFINSLPAATPMTGTLVAVQTFQKARDFQAQIQAGLPTYLKLGCAPLLGDEANILVSALNMVGVGVSLGNLTGILPAAAFAIPAL